MIVISRYEGGIPTLIPLVDSHSHLGKEEVLSGVGVDYRKTTVREMFELFDKVKYEMNKTYKCDSFLWSAPLFPEYEVALSTDLGAMVDKIVVFPFNDILRTKAEPLFHKSNEFILTRIRNPRFSHKLVGFCRVDPKDGEKAVEEVKERAREGMRGLKLHPLSQEFLDKITSPNVIEVVETAAELEMPIIFDCQNVPTGEDIFKVAEIIRDEVTKDFAIIIAHYCFSYTSQKMLEFLKDPNVYADISGIHGGNIDSLFKRLVDLDNWSRKILFGTDFNYFGSLHVCELFSFLFSRKAQDLGITVSDIKRILGINMLRLLKPLWIFEGNSLIIDKKVMWYDEFISFLRERIKFGFIDIHPLFARDDLKLNDFLMSVFDRSGRKAMLLISRSEEGRYFIRDFTDIANELMTKNELRKIIRVAGDIL